MEAKVLIIHLSRTVAVEVIISIDVPEPILIVSITMNPLQETALLQSIPVWY